MLSEIKKHLQEHPWQERIHYFETIGSTNTHAKQLATEGALEGTVIIAGQQTGGRGRLGRNFSSPGQMGVYLSVILRPNCLPQELMHLTCATAVAACAAVEEATGSCPQIKWTNDLVLGKRKLGGILTELSINSTTGLVDWVVIGIGINCCQQAEDFPEDIRQIACSLGINWTQTPPLFAALIRSLAQMRRDLLTEKEAILEAFQTRCVTIGSEISILRGEEVRHGTALGIDGDGGLLVRYSDGSQGCVTSGEVSIRGMYGYL